MLPTEGKTHIVKRPSDSALFYHKKLVSSADYEHLEGQYLYILSDSIVKEGNTNVWDTESEGTKWSPVLKGLGNTNIVKEGIEKGRFLKIVATTDKSLTIENLIHDKTLYLPSISDEFLQLYCTEGGIDEVELECAWYINSEVDKNNWTLLENQNPTKGIKEFYTEDKLQQRLKVDENNNVIISTIKSTEEKLIEEISRLQQKYDENGYDLPPLIQLQRIVQHLKGVSTIKDSNSFEWKSNTELPNKRKDSYNIVIEYENGHMEVETDFWVRVNHNEIKRWIELPD
jgi:hypothetical protein